MRKHWSCGAAVMVFLFLSVCGAAAQGPGAQGVGAEKTSQKTDASHSYNPMNWVKKDSHTKVEKPKKIKNKKEKFVAVDAAAKPR
jgi:hypothetical protein